MGMKFLRTRLENLIWCLLFTVSFSDHHFGLCDDSNSVLYKWFFLLIHLIFSNCSLFFIYNNKIWLAVIL